MTLVELLATIALLSVVLSLVGAVHLFGQKQFLAQSDAAGQSNDFAYALSVISKEVRKESFSSLEVSEEGPVLSIGGVKRFRQQGEELVKNENQVLTDGVADFTVELNAADKSVTIELISIPKYNNQSKKYQTKIYLRS
jgi:Tfp pilus assembly protein PilW